MQDETLSVLVVDDDAAVLKAVVLVLNRTGWAVQTAPNAGAAFTLIQKSPPDVILWDAELPEVTGPQFVMRIKSDPAMAHIPVVLMTAFADRTAFAEAQWDGFVEKPFGPKELLEAIERVLPTF